MTVWIIARLTFREASRRWVVWMALLLGAVFLGVYALGFNEIHKQLQRDPMTRGVVGTSEVYGFYLMAGLYVVNFLATIMTVLTSVDTLSGEINTGTVHTLVSKPMHRWELVLGKWLGFAVMLGLYLILMGGGVMLIVNLIAGYVVRNAAIGLALMAMNYMLILSISLMGGSTLSTLANGVLVFGLTGVAFIGGWIEQIGLLIKNTTATNIGIVTSLIMPSDAIWKRAAYEMQSPLVKAFGGVTPFSVASSPSMIMMVYAILYLLVMLGLAVWRFGQRDL
jgi:Cu-processing system permease protein